MKKVELAMVLTRPAKSSGADRYEAQVEGEKNPFAIYILQRWSRKANTPAPVIKVTLEVEDK